MIIILAFYTGTFYYKNLPPTGDVKQKEQILNDGKNKLFIKQSKDGKIYITDSGFFNRIKSIDKFVDFDLKPYILKEFGTLKIKNLTMLKVCISSLQAAIEICKTLQVEQVTMPIFKNKLNKSGWRQFFLLKEMLSKDNILFIRTNSSTPQIISN